MAFVTNRLNYTTEPMGGRNSVNLFMVAILNALIIQFY